MLSVHRFGACSCFGRFCTSAVHQKQFSSYTNIGDKYVRHVAPNSINWYPGHMQKGLKAISTRLAQVDVIIELHDARIPFTGRCQFVKEASQIRPHILVMNKADLAEPIVNIKKHKDLISRDLSTGVMYQPPAEIIFSNLKSPERQKQLLRDLTSCCGEFADLNDCDTSSYPIGIEERSVTAMVVGLPNCGKSSLINALRCFSASTGNGRRLRKQTAAVGVGRDAGRTRAVGGPVVIAHQYPLTSADGTKTRASFTVRLVDTPGILEPKAQSLCGQLSLAVCGAVDWNAVDKILLADYLLFCLNNRLRFDYVTAFGMPSPTANVDQLLAWVAARHHLFLPQPATARRHRQHLQETCSSSTSPHIPMPDFNAAAQHFLRAFNDGRLGRLTLLPQVDEEAARPWFTLAL